jgi:hypothetical protein
MHENFSVRCMIAVFVVRALVVRIYAVFSRRGRIDYNNRETEKKLFEGDEALLALLRLDVVPTSYFLPFPDLPCFLSNINDFYNWENFIWMLVSVPNVWRCVHNSFIE